MNILDDMMLIKSESVTLSVTDGTKETYSETCTYNVYWDDGFGRYALITQGKLANYHPKYNELLTEVANQNAELFKDFDEIMNSEEIKMKLESKPKPKGKRIVVLEKDVTEDVEELKKSFRSKDKTLKQFIERQFETKYKDYEVFAKFDNVIVTDKAILISIFDEQDKG